MITRHTLLPLLCFVALFCMRVSGQSTSLSDIRGKTKGMPQNGVFKALQGNPEAVKAINHTLLAQFHTLMQLRVLAEPVGFDLTVHPYISDYLPQMGHKRYQGGMAFFLFNYFQNQSGVIQRVEEAPAQIDIFFNPEDFMTHRAGFFEPKDTKTNIPHPFQKIPLTATTDDYEEYSFKDYPFHEGYYRNFSFRIIKRHDRPVFIPFTRQQYLEYLISLANLERQACDEKIEDFQKQVIELKKLQSNKEVKAEFKKLVPQSLKSLEQGINSQENQKDKIRQKIARYRDVIQQMSPETAHATAYVNLEVPPKEATEHLVAAGRREGYPLYIVNPDYYDNTLPPHSIQALIVAYAWSPQFCPDFLQKRTRQIFDELDYHQLKQSITP